MYNNNHGSLRIQVLRKKIANGEQPVREEIGRMVRAVVSEILGFAYLGEEMVEFAKKTLDSAREMVVILSPWRNAFGREVQTLDTFEAVARETLSRYEPFLQARLISGTEHGAEVLKILIEKDGASRAQLSEKVHEMFLDSILETFERGGVIIVDRTGFEPLYSLSPAGTPLTPPYTG